MITLGFDDVDWIKLVERKQFINCLLSFGEWTQSCVSNKLYN